MIKNINKSQPSAWHFVEKYYPNYYQSDIIAKADDLAKIISGEMNKNSIAEDIFINECDENMAVAKEKYNKIHVKVYKTAIENYLRINQELRYYYLFGENITKEYFDKGIHAVINTIKKKICDVSVFEWDPSDGPGVLLDAADGWMGSATISKKDYLKIKKLLNPKDRKTKKSSRIKII